MRIEAALDAFERDAIRPHVKDRHDEIAFSLTRRLTPKPSLPMTMPYRPFLKSASVSVSPSISQAASQSPPHCSCSMVTCHIGHAGTQHILHRTCGCFRNRLRNETDRRFGMITPCAPAFCPSAVAPQIVGITSPSAGSQRIFARCFATFRISSTVAYS